MAGPTKYKLHVSKCLLLVTLKEGKSVLQHLTSQLSDLLSMGAVGISGEKTYFLLISQDK